MMDVGIVAKNDMEARIIDDIQSNIVEISASCMKREVSLNEANDHMSYCKSCKRKSALVIAPKLVVLLLMRCCC